MKFYMKKISFFILVVLCSLIFTGMKPYRQANVMYNASSVEAPLVTEPVKIDGDLSEWKGFSATAATVKDNLELGKIDGDKDLKGIFYFAWDREYLYFAASVNDNQIIRLEDNEGIWKDDCIELFMDPAYDKLNWGDSKDFQIGIAPASGEKVTATWAWFQKMSPEENMKTVSVLRKGGYDVEAAIKWEFLGMSPEEGLRLGVSPAFHDKDNDGSDNGKLNWFYNRGIFGKLGRLILVNKQSEGEIKSSLSKKSKGVIPPEEYYEGLMDDKNDCYPRWMVQKQSYWTIAGVEDDTEEFLICEDGSVEPYSRGFSVMPFLFIDEAVSSGGKRNGRLVTRDDANITQSLEKGYLPIPSVRWDFKKLFMDIKVFTDGEAGKSSAYAMYSIRNGSDKEISGSMFLALEPFQVFPPWHGGGGMSAVSSIKYDSGKITVNGKYEICLLTFPEGFGVKDGVFGTEKEIDGDIISCISEGILPQEKNVEEPNGFATGAVEYRFKLAAGEQKEIFLAMPLHRASPVADSGLAQEKIKQVLSEKLEQNIKNWDSKVSDIEIDIPEKGITEMLKSSVLYNLVTKDGLGFQPGSRSYDKVWMRDGGMAAASMLRMGFVKEIKDFIDWYGGFQFESGEIPPIIDSKAKDHLWEEKEKGLIEYDSQGEYVYTVLQYYNFTNDKEFLEKNFEKVKKALEFLVELRTRTLKQEFLESTDGKKQFYGILPPSTSHEGYASEYSYWDDFWALKGWKDGAAIFSILGKDDLALWAKSEYEKLKKSFYDSVEETAKHYKINYIAGSASLGDLDPTSTAVAVMYCDEMDNLPKDKLKATFDKYYQDLKSRMKKGAEYRFTPYELRSTPAYIYMGQKNRALELLRFMVSCRRPEKWNHLAEVVHSDYRFPTYIGDMPHTWVGSEYINAVRVMFVYEKNDGLILGSGIDEKWLDRKEGISVKNMPTYYGKVNYTVVKEDDILKVKVSGDAVPPAGFIFRSPFMNKKISSVKLNGKNWKKFSGSEVTFEKLPAEIIVSY